MKERPILFSSEMVGAILHGRKGWRDFKVFLTLMHRKADSALKEIEGEK